MHQIEWKESAIKQLNKLDSFIAKRVFSSIEGLQIDPFKKDIKKLKGSSDFRLRVGDYRVIFSIQNSVITILKIAHRQHIYER